MKSNPNLTSLYEELKDSLLDECQRDAVKNEIHLLEEKSIQLKNEIRNISLQMEDCFNSKDDIEYNKLFSKRAELYTLFISIM